MLLTVLDKTGNAECLSINFPAKAGCGFTASSSGVKENDYMSITINYFVHSSTNDNENNILSGWSDIGLSKIGIKQAEELHVLLADKKFDQVYCSDLRRAIETAEIVFTSKYEIKRDSRLREIDYGDMTNCSKGILKIHKEISDPFPGGESHKDVENRIQNFIDYLRNNYDNQNIAVVSHWIPQLSFDVLLKNISWAEAFRQDWRVNGKWEPGWKYEIII